MNNSSRIWAIVPELCSGEHVSLYNDFNRMVIDLRSYAVESTYQYFDIEGVVVEEKFRTIHSDEPIPKFIAEDYVRNCCAQRTVPYEYGEIIFDHGKCEVASGYDYDRHRYTELEQVRKAIYDSVVAIVNKAVANGNWHRAEDLDKEE